MSSRDVVSTRHITQLFGDDPPDTFLISGPVRLFNVWPTRGTNAALVTVILKNGTSSGDVLLKFDWGSSFWPQPNNNIEIPGGGILFPDGLYFDSGNGSTGSTADRLIETVTLLYQKG